MQLASIHRRALKLSNATVTRTTFKCVTPQDLENAINVLSLELIACSNGFDVYDSNEAFESKFYIVRHNPEGETLQVKCHRTLDNPLIKQGL